MKTLMIVLSAFALLVGAGSAGAKGRAGGDGFYQLDLISVQAGVAHFTLRRAPGGKFTFVRIELMTNCPGDLRPQFGQWAYVASDGIPVPVDGYPSGGQCQAWGFIDIPAQNDTRPDTNVVNFSA
jgi:hypothetical protein